MAWNDRLSAFQGEISSIQAALTEITSALQNTNIGVGESQISASLYALRKELDAAKRCISQMH